MPWGVAAAAVTVAGGMAEQDSASGAAKKANAPLSNAQNALYSQAESISGTPYSAYTGQRVAGLSGNQQQAVEEANQNSGPGSAAQQYIDKAGQQADFIAGNQWNSATAAKYMNPYTQNVTDLALNKENQSYASTLNANNAGATSSGAFGGDRATLTNAAATAGHNYNQGALEAEGQDAAYKSAVSTWGADNQRAASAATSYENSGNDISNMNSSDIKNLLATGGASQAVSQMKLDTGYNDYLDKRSWATNQLAPLESAAGRTPTLAPVMPANYAGAMMGAGTALAGYFGSNTNSGNTSALSTSLNNTSAANTASELGATSDYGSTLDNASAGAGSNLSFGTGADDAIAAGVS